MNTDGLKKSSSERIWIQVCIELKLRSFTGHSENSEDLVVLQIQTGMAQQMDAN